METNGKKVTGTETVLSRIKCKFLILKIKNNTKMKANIFDYATKELSQDAFLLWLIQQADNCYTDDMGLHNTAQKFVSTLIKKKYPNYNRLIESIKVYKQNERIDVSFDINDDLFIIIEDKTGTTVHGTQLMDYKNDAQEYCDGCNRKLICVYIKTGNESRSSIEKNVKSEGYIPITRKEIIDLLSDCHTPNNILSDYLEHLNSIEEKTNSYLKKPYNDWENENWQGFYMKIDEMMEDEKDCDWKYVPNQSGGFWTFNWHWIEVDDCSLFLQIEEGNLCIKIGELYEGANYSEIRDKWRDIVLQKAKDLSYCAVHRPNRMGYGEYMTIAVISAKDYLGEDYINVEKVIDELHKYEHLIDLSSEIQ